MQLLNEITTFLRESHQHVARLQVASGGTGGSSRSEHSGQWESGGSAGNHQSGGGASRRSQISTSGSGGGSSHSAFKATRRRLSILMPIFVQSQEGKSADKHSSGIGEEGPNEDYGEQIGVVWGGVVCDDKRQTENLNLTELYFLTQRRLNQVGATAIDRSVLQLKMWIVNAPPPSRAASRRSMQRQRTQRSQVRIANDTASETEELLMSIIFFFFLQVENRSRRISRKNVTGLGVFGNRFK